MNVSGILSKDSSYTPQLKASANEQFLDLPDTLWTEIIRMVSQEKKDEESLTLTSKRFCSLTRQPPESLERLFKVIHPIRINSPRQLQKSFPNITTKVEEDVVVRRGKQELHVYDSSSGSSAYVKLYRDTILDTHYNKESRNLCIVGSKKTYAVKFTDKGCQANEVPAEKTPKRTSSPLGKAKIQKTEDISLNGIDAIMLNCLFIKPMIDSSLDTMDFYTKISNVLSPYTPQMIKSFKIFKSKTLTCRENGLVEIIEDKDATLVKKFYLENSKSKIIDIALYSRFLAIARKNSKNIDIVDVLTEKTLHTFVAKSEIESLYFEKDQLIVCQKSWTVEIWGNDKKVPSELISFNMNAPSNTQKKANQTKDKAKMSKEQIAHENDKIWLKQFMEASSVSN